MSQTHRFLAFLAATGALVLTLGVVGPRVLGLASGPETEVITSLKMLERKGFSVDLGFGTLHSTSVQYQRLSVTLDANGERALVTATLDFTGNIERRGAPFRTKVSSLGLERLEYRLVNGEWVVTGSTVERLRAVLNALEARRGGFEAPLDGVSRRVHRASAWFIRSEREEVLVSEDWLQQEDRADRPVDEQGTTRLQFGERDGGFALLP